MQRKLNKAQVEASIATARVSRGSWMIRARYRKSIGYSPNLAVRYARENNRAILYYKRLLAGDIWTGGRAVREGTW